MKPTPGIVPRLRGFKADESGTIAVIWALSLVAFIGLAASVYDIGTMVSEQGELQSYTDQVALAAAGELDGKAGAISRAQAAAAELIVGRQSFGDGDRILSGSASYTLTFYERLPASDRTALTGALDPFDADSDGLAAFAQVVAVPRSVPLRFMTGLNRLLGTSNSAISASVGAVAVAGLTQEACDITPLMFCLPSPGYTADGNIGHMVWLRAGGNSAAWGPGNFGFLRLDRADLGATCAGLNGAQRDRCLLAAQEGVSVCYRKKGVDTEPGQKAGIEDVALNTRFDIFNGSMQNDRNDARYSPAQNVIKGIRRQSNGNGNGNGNGNACIGQNAEATTNTLALPRDPCITSGGCGRFGDGGFSADAYLDKNYGDGNGTRLQSEGAALFSEEITADAEALDPEFFENYGGAATRYEIYLREIALANTRVTGPDANKILLNRQETGRPMCSNQVSPYIYRRTLVVAGINCDPLNGGTEIRGQTDNVPVEEYFQIFLTEPISKNVSPPNELYIYGEIIGSAGRSGYTSAGQGGIFRDIVQLYR